jgi:membrane protein DedA with SNARE-associated domain
MLGLRRIGPHAQYRNFVTSFIDPLIAFVSAHAWLAYLTLFLAALLEAVPVVGSVIPGSTIILTLSALIPGGELRLDLVLAAAVAGAMFGDGGAFWIGHRSQREILSTWPIANYPRVVAQSEAFFHRWGALAVFFARFVPPIRAFVPITAGALGMAPARFYAVNIPAILLWAPAHVLPGVLAVSAMHRYAGLPHHEGIGKLYWMLSVLGAALIVALAVWTIRRRHGGGVIEPAPNPALTPRHPRIHQDKKKTG